jgi:hypothetical protein
MVGPATRQQRRHRSAKMSHRRCWQAAGCRDNLPFPVYTAWLMPGEGQAPTGMYCSTTNMNCIHLAQQDCNAAANRRLYEQSFRPVCVSPALAMGSRGCFPPGERRRVVSCDERGANGYLRKELRPLPNCRARR